MSPQEEAQAGAAQGLGLCCPYCLCSLPCWSWGAQFGHSAPGQRSPGTNRHCRGFGAAPAALLPGDKTLPCPPLSLEQMTESCGAVRLPQLMLKYWPDRRWPLSLLQLLALGAYQGCDLLLYLPPAVIIFLLSVSQHGTYCIL